MPPDEKRQYVIDEQNLQTRDQSPHRTKSYDLITLFLSTTQLLWSGTKGLPCFFIGSDITNLQTIESASVSYVTFKRNKPSSAASPSFCLCAFVCASHLWQGQLSAQQQRDATRTYPWWILLRMNLILKNSESLLLNFSNCLFLNDARTNVAPRNTSRQIPCVRVVNIHLRFRMANSLRFVIYLPILSNSNELLQWKPNPKKKVGSIFNLSLYW